MGGEVKKYKSDFETGNDASLPILRTKQSTVTYQKPLNMQCFGQKYKFSSLKC